MRLIITSTVLLSLAAYAAGETVTTTTATTSDECQSNNAACAAAPINASNDTPVDDSEEINNDNNDDAKAPHNNDAADTNNQRHDNNHADNNLVWDFPSGWKEYTYIQIRDHFHCPERSRDNNKPLPTLDEWQLMRDTYTRIVDISKTWDDDAVPPTLGYSLEPDIPVPPPFYPKLTRDKGRGLFASRDIKKGEVVHVGERNDVVFPDSTKWKEYVFSLPPPLACDAAEWCWMQRLKKDGPYKMICSLNISSLINSGGVEFGPGRMPNAMPRTELSGVFDATRHIRKGDEILTDYDAYYTNWGLIGL